MFAAQLQSPSIVVLWSWNQTEICAQEANTSELSCVPSSQCAFLSAVSLFLKSCLSVIHRLASNSQTQTSFLSQATSSETTSTCYHQARLQCSFLHMNPPKYFSQKFYSEIFSTFLILWFGFVGPGIKSSIFHILNKYSASMLHPSYPVLLL